MVVGVAGSSPLGASFISLLHPAVCVCSLAEFALAWSLHTFVGVGFAAPGNKENKCDVLPGLAKPRANVHRVRARGVKDLPVNSPAIVASTRTWRRRSLSKAAEPSPARDGARLASSCPCRSRRRVLYCGLVVPGTESPRKTHLPPGLTRRLSLSIAP